MLILQLFSRRLLNMCLKSIYPLKTEEWKMALKPTQLHTLVAPRTAARTWDIRHGTWDFGHGT